jgi:hypothetical protein
MRSTASSTVSGSAALGSSTGPRPPQPRSGPRALARVVKRDFAHSYEAAGRPAPTSTCPGGNVTAPSRWRSRTRGQSGAMAAEHVAVLAVIGTVLAAVLALPLAPAVSDWGRYAVCSLFGEGCERPGTSRMGLPTADPATIRCLDARGSESVHGSVTVMSVQVSGDLAYQIDRHSDGTHDVTLALSGGLGAELIAGGKLSADALGVKGGRQGAVELSADATLAPVFTFSSEDDALRFAESARDLVAGPGRDVWDWRTLIPVYGPGRVAANQLDRMRSFDPPPPSRLRVDGAVDLVASGEFFGGAGGASGLLGAGRTLGADIDLTSGDTTIYVAMEGRVAAELGLGPAVAAPIGANLRPGGQLDGELVVAVTVDRSLVPNRLDLGMTVSGHGGIQGIGLESFMFEGGAFSGLEHELSAALANVGMNARDDRSFALSGTASLDLTDPRSGTVGTDLLDALASRDPTELRRAGDAVRGHLLHETELAAQLHTGSRSAFDLSASGGKGVAFGLGLSHERAEQELVAAWHRPAGGRFGFATCG